MKHTPGPWTINGLGIEGPEDDRGLSEYIAHVSNDCDASEANSHLIAAAPELLEALKLARAAFRGTNDDGSYRGDGIIFTDDARDQIEAVIAKAEGK
jgi:hypothetical protein